MVGEDARPSSALGAGAVASSYAAMGADVAAPGTVVDAAASGVVGSGVPVAGGTRLLYQRSRKTFSTWSVKAASSRGPRERACCADTGGPVADVCRAATRAASTGAAAFQEGIVAGSPLKVGCLPAAAAGGAVATRWAAGTVAGTRSACRGGKHRLRRSAGR